MKLQRDLPLEVFKPHVQIYAIVEVGSGDYDLLGHGFLAIVTDEVDEETVNYLEVESTKDGELLLRSRLRLSNNFQKQRGSVIVWNDSSQKRFYDLALSFEGDKECDIFWRLICEKLGKNYLEINSRESLELPNESNLLYILDKTKTAKDMVEYHLLNCPPFAAALTSLFDKFNTKGDKMGMGMIGRIVRSILTNLDYKMVQALFKDPTFSLLLNVHKFLTDIDFPQMWEDSVRIRNIIHLGQELMQKILLIHRLNFYRESVLDLTKEGYLEHILVMTQIQLSKEIITYLTKSSAIEELINMSYIPEISKKDIIEDQTNLNQKQQIKKQEFAEKKIAFIMQALIMSKQMQCQKGFQRFLDKIIKSQAMDMATQYLDQGILKSLDFFNCLAQLSPPKFLQYLRAGFRERPSESLHSKLSKKYCLGSQQMQNKILQLVHSISDTFRNKQNLDFFMGTFLATVFSCCSQPKAILNVVCDLQNQLENAENLMTQVLRSKVFDKIVPFLRNQRPDKVTELRAVKLLKRILIDNADSSWKFRKNYLSQINQQMIKSGFFDYCMTLLLKNIRMNNILSSSMLENLKIIKETNRFTLFHSQIQQNYRELVILEKYLKEIMEIKEEVDENKEGEFQKQLFQEIQQEKEEAYLMGQGEPEQSLNFSQEIAKNQQKIEQLESLRKLKEEIGKEQEDTDVMGFPSKKVKKDSEVEISITFDLPFDEEGDK